MVSKRPLLWLTALFLVLALLLSACGDSPTATTVATTAATTTTTQAASATTAAPAATTAAATRAAGSVATAPAQVNGGKATTLRVLIHQNAPLVEFIGKFSEKFKARYPNVTVDVSVVPPDQLDQSIQTRLTAGDIDVFENTQAFTNAPQDFMKGVDDPTWVQWIKGGLLEDLTNQPFIKNYDANALKSASTYNGKIYALSTGRYAYSGVFYNKELFEKNGVKVPTTWTEFVNVAQTLKSKNIAPLTVGGKDGWPIGVVGASGLLLSTFPDQQALAKGLWTGQTKFNDANSLNYFEKGRQYLSFFENGIASIDYQTAPGRFAAGKAAMYPAGTWDAPTIIKANPNIKMGYFPFPGSDDASQNKTLAGKYDVQWYVPAKAPAKEAALAWLAFFSEPANYSEYVATTGILPNQPDISLTAEFAKDIQPYLPTFKVAFSEMMLSPKNVGKYAGFALNNFTPFGDVEAAKDLADKSQADWEAAFK
jgi:raffinose/stachyose/melibiose transport system substrate-binding protein